MPYNALVAKPPLSIPNQPRPLIAGLMFYPPQIGSTQVGGIIRPQSGQVWPRV